MWNPQKILGHFMFKIGHSFIFTGKTPKKSDTSGQASPAAAVNSTCRRTPPCRGYTVTDRALWHQGVEAERKKGCSTMWGHHTL